MAINGVQNKGILLEISIAAPQNNDLTASEFAALTYVPICCASELPEFGNETEFLSEHCISGEEIIGVGASTGMETEVSYFYRASCQGQQFLRENSVSGSTDMLNAYAVRKVYPDGTDDATPSTIYSRVMIGAWSDGGGGVGDFVTHTSSWKMAQDPVFVEPEDI